ncbi:MAG: hypothetical protein ACI4VH_03240 [Clostridia bacterium]
MNSDLIPTNGLWYKIKKFFKNIFSKTKLHNVNEVQTSKENQIYNNVIANDNLKEKFERDTNKQLLANNLLYGVLGTSELNETEVNEMTEYFTKDIQNIDNELVKIKQHILTMRKKLK